MQVGSLSLSLSQKGSNMFLSIVLSWVRNDVYILSTSFDPMIKMAYHLSVALYTTNLVMYHTQYRYTNCNWMYDGQIEFNVLIWRDFDVNESIWAHCWWYMDIEVIPSDDQTPRHNIFFKSITMLRGIDNTPWNIPWCSPHSSYWMWEMSRNIMWYTTSPT